jgi:cytoplasmic iron level regulating protein YaaA (DUF328/UPF0246 family)
MLFLLSPAKSLDFEPVSEDVPHTDPLFLKQAAKLIRVLKTKQPHEVASLMDLSDNLAALNVARYQAWSSRFTASNAKQAMLAFDGDVYDGLRAKTLKPRQLSWAQEHVCILSGLYGVLRPLDWMQPYRLEMGTGLATADGKNLYQFWGDQISTYLNSRLIVDKSPVVVNLASQEYFKVVDQKVLNARVIECVFEDWKSGQFKIISFFAKRARGMMARFAIEHRVGTPVGLKKFDTDGYQFAPEPSTADRLVFRRKTTV